MVSRIILPFILPAAIGLFLSLFWLVFFLFEDRKQPEPKRMIGKIFLVGAASALIAAILQWYFYKIISLVNINNYSLTAFLIYAAIEEIIKFGAVYFAIRKSKFFDEPIDAMIYMITAALGFAALENILFLTREVMVIEVAILRFVGATLLHALASGFIGFYWMKGGLIKGITIAVLLHASFNYLVLHLGNAPIYATPVLLFASFLLFYDFDIIKECRKKPNQKKT